VTTGDEWQLVLVDLPGVQRPRDSLTKRMQRRMERELADADAALFLLNGAQAIGPGDRFIAEAIKRAGVPAVTALNKVDSVSRARVLEALEATAALDVQGEIFPISALTGEGVPSLVEELVRLVPEGPFLFPPDERTDLPPRVRIAELIREQILRRTHDEIPHSVEVEIEDATERDDGLLAIEAHALVETESQKAILIGAGGRMVRAVGTAARGEIEELVGTHVHLDLSVRVRRRWRQDERMLDRLGID
jgi:GTP-binding protein Era